MADWFRRKSWTRTDEEAYLDYSELVVKTGDRTSFDEVEQILLERQPELTSPIEKSK